jgi:hypothetical protein
MLPTDFVAVPIKLPGVMLLSVAFFTSRKCVFGVRETVSSPLAVWITSFVASIEDTVPRTLSWAGSAMAEVASPIVRIPVRAKALFTERPHA